MSFLDTLANTLSRETFAGRNFGDFGEFWTYLEKFDPPFQKKKYFLKKIANVYTKSTSNANLMKIETAYCSLNMSKNHQVLSMNHSQELYFREKHCY